MFIPARNDANEGALGSLRVFVRYRPNAATSTFSHKARAQRNNTENFIIKHCDVDDHLYVMRRARKEDASGANSQFRTDLIEAQCARAEAERTRQAKIAARERAEIARLVEIGLEGDQQKILKMTVRQLDDQLKIYRKILKDETLLAVKIGTLKLKAQKQAAVLEALARNQEVIRDMQRLLQDLELPTPGDPLLLPDDRADFDAEMEDELT
ncbi:hypothetical protein HGRIS_003239 [Hohenbuehelia grisea]|uniref:Uncharacterized protein n=1 Tax=Hohenbuehelia grisea TaxID=104357 RepID=A0ABR3JN37_9AGAR